MRFSDPQSRRRRGGSGGVPSERKRGFPLFRILLVLGAIYGLNTRFSFWTFSPSEDALSVSSSSSFFSSRAEPDPASLPSPQPIAPIPEREWFRMESKPLSGQRTLVVYRFPADTAVWSALQDTARLPASLRPMIVEALLIGEEYSMSPEFSAVLDLNGEPVSWGWKIGGEQTTFTRTDAGWVDEKGCLKQTACPWKNFGRLAGRTVGPGRWEATRGTKGAVYSYLTGQLSSVRQSDGYWSVTVYQAPEIYAEWSRLRQLAPTVREGERVEAGDPLGAAGDLPPVLTLRMMGRPVDPVVLWRTSWSSSVREEVHSEAS